MATNPYADGCAFIEGNFFRLDDHLERFENSYTQLRMEPTISLAEMRQIRNQNHEVKIILRQEHLTFGDSRKGSGSP